MICKELPTTEIYETTCYWWLGNSWPVAPIDCLPPTGFIVDEYCVGYLYLTNSNIALLEWVVGNPKADKEKRSLALDFLLEELIESARAAGKKAIFSTTKNKKFSDRLVKHNFKITEENNINLLRGIV